jgi:hypothetical protein
VISGFLGSFHSSSGAAYVFIREGSSWSQQAYLKASNTGDSDQFGVLSLFLVKRL